MMNAQMIIMILDSNEGNQWTILCPSDPILNLFFIMTFIIKNNFTYKKYIEK
jgi:hypothetical protein